MKHHFPGLLKDHTAAGTLRWRVRVEGHPNRKIRIPVGPGEPGFHEHYFAARAGHTLETVKPKAPKAGTLDALCDRYLEAMEARVQAGKASPLTLRGHRSLLNQVREFKDPDGDRMGSLDADMPKAAFIHIQDSFGSRTGAADNALKALCAAYRWGADRGFPEDSAVFRVKRVHQPGGGATPWTEKDVKAFLKTHGPGTTARLWFLLAFNSLGRIGDMHRLGPGNLDQADGETFLSWQPSKKGSAPVSVPLLPSLEEELGRHDIQGAFLRTEYGRPFASSNSLDNRVRKWTIAAGLVGLDGKATRSQHGIRKATAEAIAAAGATQYELMSAMSHTQAKTSEIYTKAVQRRGLAAAAIARLRDLDLG
ncbi:tyrosine-type recombinase/integrase [Rhodovulum euryhalinum]|uniref:Phage integrase family protein n=1 Tax=Rhodovulum euryhalinum TaxID=35805 RepID=A0A4R2K8Q4_9RHOB|nr:tyrosine-type recombinase/integrase [Rhodovulum euryhalinum]TCO69014.1 phage integrase family protein [Rhodovulum euryhalinum]